MPRRITTDTFLTITGPGINIKVCRALADPAGNVAVWWKPNGAPQRLFTVGREGIKMRGQMTTPDGVTVAYRRRGVSCTWSICKGKFTTRQVAAWWPEDGTTTAATDEAPKVAPVRTSVATAAPARRKRPVTVAERRAARARARAARETRATVAERRAAAAKAAEDVAATADKLDQALGGPGLDVEPSPNDWVKPVGHDGEHHPQSLNGPGAESMSGEDVAAAEERITEYALNPETMGEDEAGESTPDDRMDHLEIPGPASEPDAPKDAISHEWTEEDGLITQTIVTPAPKPKPPTNAEYRAWARDNGYEVSSRGKISDAIKAAYAAAQEA